VTRIWHVRAAILTLVGIVAVHQGRYLFATPEHEHALSAAHGYLLWLTPLAAVLGLLGFVHLLAAASRARGGAGARLPGTGALWLAVTATLLSAFAAQESLETLFTHGAFPTFAELLGEGGWTAIPFAIAVGAVIALLLRGAAHVARWALWRGRRRVVRQAPLALALPRPAVLPAPRSVLARRLAGRGPPALS
jgi:hypothetical protein